MKEPQIGWWALTCCCQDAQQITTKEELEEYLAENKEAEEDGDGGSYHFYESVEEIIKQSCSCDGKCHLLTPPQTHSIKE